VEVITDGDHTSHASDRDWAANQNYEWVSKSWTSYDQGNMVIDVKFDTIDDPAGLKKTE